MFKFQMLSFPLLLICASCTPQQAKVIEDIVEGEAQVIEKAIDESISRPQVSLVK